MPRREEEKIQIEIPEGISKCEFGGQFETGANKVRCYQCYQLLEAHLDRPSFFDNR